MGGKNEFSVYFPVDGESDMNVEHINVQYAVMEGGGKWLPGGTSLQFPVELDQFFFIHPASPLESAERFKQVNALNFVGLSFLLLWHKCPCLGKEGIKKCFAHKSSSRYHRREYICCENDKYFQLFLKFCKKY